MAHAQVASESPTGRHQRRLKNYLLDRRFQIKYANLFAGIALVVSGALGVLLWQANRETIEQSQAGVALMQEVVEESRKVSEVVAMNIVKDPIYSDNPLLKDAFEQDAKSQDAELNRQQSTLQAQSEGLARQSKQFAVVLIAVLVILVVTLWFAGIWITHKVAGPIYKMTKQIKAVEQGDLVVPSPLRKGDELIEFFEAFRHMVRSMRHRQHEEIEQLEEAIRRLSGTNPDAHIEPLLALRDRMKHSLGATEAPPRA
jgi:methyl-accepting chemotaxis protein